MRAVVQQICGFLPTCNIVQLVAVKLWSGEIRSVRRVLPHGSVSISLPCIYLVDYFIQSTPRPHLFALPWVEGKACFCMGLQGSPGNRGNPSLSVTGSWGQFLWLRFRLWKSRDLQGFPMVPRADPTRGQMCLKTPTRHRWHPTL